MAENAAIDLDTAASLASLCVESAQALSCDDRNFDDFDSCYNDESAYYGACSSFFDYISPDQ